MFACVFCRLELLFLEVALVVFLDFGLLVEETIVAVLVYLLAHLQILAAQDPLRLRLDLKISLPIIDTQPSKRAISQIGIQALQEHIAKLLLLSLRNLIQMQEPNFEILLPVKFLNEVDYPP